MRGAAGVPPLAAHWEKDMLRKKYYVCDRKRCEHCSTECHHTTDERHAKYDSHYDFELQRDGSLWEKVRR